MIYSFLSSDTGAPVLSGQVGALIGVLDAILVNGYNQQTGVTATQTGGVATFTKTSHGYRVGQLLAITGFTTTDYNVTGLVLSVTSNTWTMAVSSGAATPAVGTGTTIVTPLGCTKAFSGTNLASYRWPVGTNRFYLGVDDTNAQNARIRGFESMTAAGVAVASGTNPFPTDIQLSGGLYSYKSSTANSTARTWRAYSDGKLLHYIPNPNGSNTERQSFGDFISFKSGDAYNTMIQGDGSASVTSSPHGWTASSSYTAALTGFYLCRKSDQTTASVNGSMLQDSPHTNTRMGNGPWTYPSPIAGGLGLTRMLIYDAVSGNDPRGYVQGLWCPLTFMGASWADGDTFSASVGSALTGRAWMWFLGDNGNSYSGAIENTDTWSSY